MSRNLIVSLYFGRWYKVKCRVLITICRSLVPSAKRSFVRCWIAWRGSFGLGTTVIKNVDCFDFQDFPATWLHQLIVLNCSVPKQSLEITLALV